MNNRIYLCGPINGCSDAEAKTWREWFKEYTTDVTYVDPMKRDYRGREIQDYQEIVELDKRDILSCDYIVVMYTKPSVGASMEVLFAWENNIPVIVINESAGPLSPWLIYHSTTIVSTKQEAVDKLIKWTR